MSHMFKDLVSHSVGDGSWLAWRGVPPWFAERGEGIATHFSEPPPRFARQELYSFIVVQKCQPRACRGRVHWCVNGSLVYAWVLVRYPSPGQECLASEEASTTAPPSFTCSAGDKGRAGTRPPQGRLWLPGQERPHQLWAGRVDPGRTGPPHRGSGRQRAVRAARRRRHGGRDREGAPEGSGARPGGGHGAFQGAHPWSGARAWR